MLCNNSLIGGLIAFPGASPYVASKQTVIGLTRLAVIDYAKQGIGINAVNPGSIATESFDRALIKMGITADNLGSMVPMSHIA